MDDQEVVHVFVRSQEFERSELSENIHRDGFRLVLSAVITSKRGGLGSGTVGHRQHTGQAERRFYPRAK